MDLKNHCVICGIKSKELKDHMCPVCKSLADEKFYPLENEFKVRAYFKDYLGKVPDKKARDEISQIFKKKPTTEWLHGIMPSKCPFCNNLATNRGIIQGIRIGSPEYKKIIEEGKLPSLVCKRCGDLSLYLNHVYDFSREQSVEVLKHIAEIEEQIKKENLVSCQKCARGLGKKEDYEKNLTEEEKELLTKHAKKFICKPCMESLNGNDKNQDRIQKH